MYLSLRDHRSPAGVDKWIAEIGCTSAPIPGEGIRTPLAFFEAEMPTLSIADAVGFLAAMGLSRPVRRIVLRSGERLIGFRMPTESPFKLFFTRRGESPHRSGINTAARGAVHFVVRVPVQARESFPTGAIDTWTPRQPGQRLTAAPRAKRWGTDFGAMATAG